jgi:hypothetical protein
MIYLASPYSHPDQAVVEQRVLQTMEVFHYLCKFSPDRAIFSPILQCHETAKNFKMPTDAKFWQDYNTGFLRIATTVVVACLPDWEQSLGVKQEVELALQLGIEVEYKEHHAASFGQAW